MKNEATLIRQFKIAIHNALAFPEILQQLEQHTLTKRRSKKVRRLGNAPYNCDNSTSNSKLDSKEATRLFQEAFAKADSLLRRH